MSLMLALIGRNIPLYKWREHSEENLSSRRFSGFDCGGKTVDNVVNTIVNSLSHSQGVELLVREFIDLPSNVRMALTDACNKAHGTRSGNKTKGITEANHRLGGRLLKEERPRRTIQERYEGPDGVFRRTRLVNPSKAGAERKYAGTTLPANFGSLSKKDQKQIRKELGDVRRRQA